MNVDAQLDFGRDKLFGSVLDIHSEGAFFRPENAILDNEFAPVLEPVSRVTENDRVSVKLQRGESLFDAFATIRWVGCSEDHASHGLGLKFLGGLRRTGAQKLN